MILSKHNFIKVYLKIKSTRISSVTIQLVLEEWFKRNKVMQENRCFMILIEVLGQIIGKIWPHRFMKIKTVQMKLQELPTKIKVKSQPQAWKQKMLKFFVPLRMLLRNFTQQKIEEKWNLELVSKLGGEKNKRNLNNKSKFYLKKSLLKIFLHNFTQQKIKVKFVPEWLLIIGEIKKFRNVTTQQA